MKLILFLIGILSLNLALRSINKPRIQASDKFKIRNQLQASSTAGSGQKARFNTKSMSSSKGGEGDDVTEDDPNAPTWVGIIQNLRLKGFGTSELYGSFLFLNFGFVVQTGDVPHTVQELLLEHNEVLEASRVSAQLLAQGMYYSNFGEDPPQDSTVVKEYFDDVISTFDEPQRMGNDGELIILRLFDKCQFSWVDSYNEKWSNKQGIEGNFVKQDGGFASSSCRVMNQIGFYKIGVFPNSKFHKDLVHDANNIVVMTNWCTANRALIQSATKDFLSKYTIFLEIKEVKKLLKQKTDELLDLIKKLGLETEKWKELWAVVGLESSTIGDWLRQMKSAYDSRDEDYTFSQNDKVLHLNYPGMVLTDNIQNEPSIHNNVRNQQDDDDDLGHTGQNNNQIK